MVFTKPSVVRPVVIPKYSAVPGHAYCPALVDIGAATSGRTKEEALARINEVVHMIVEEFIDEGKALPEGPVDDVEVIFDRHLCLRFRTHFVGYDRANLIGAGVENWTGDAVK